jgi:xanthine dehydrogenase accessory factor
MGIYERLATLEREGGMAALATIIRSRGSVPRREGSKMLVFPDGRIEGTIGGGELEVRVMEEALQTMKDGKTRLLEYSFVDPEKGDVGVCGGEVEVFVEPVCPNPTMIVIGGGHVGKAVAHLASWLGYRVVVSDDRSEFASPEAVPDADAYINSALADLPTEIEINEATIVVLTTRGVDIDVSGLPAILDTPAAYIGIIGSRRRWETTVQKLIEMGISDDKIARVTSPIGLELNAETPEEIAVSIMAEIIMLRRGGAGGRMTHSPVKKRSRKGA